MRYTDGYAAKNGSIPQIELAIPDLGQFDIKRIAQAHWADGLNRNPNVDSDFDVLLGCGADIEDAEQVSATRAGVGRATADSR